MRCRDPLHRHTKQRPASSPMPRTRLLIAHAKQSPVLPRAKQRAFASGWRERTLIWAGEADALRLRGGRIALLRDVEHGIGAAKGSLGRVPETLLRPHLAPTRGAFPAGSRHSGSRRARGRSRQRSHPAARWLADQHSTHSLLCPRRFEPGARGPSATASPAVSRSQRGRGLAHAPGPRRPVRASPS